MRMLVTGATGYIGGRLVPRLLEEGHAVRCLVRDPARVQGRLWTNAVEVVRGDVVGGEGLDAAMASVDLAYYLVHSMAGGKGFHERDLAAAANFGAAAKRAGVRRIVYLGGLGESGTDLSPHLRSRQETGEALRAAGVPVTEFRAGVIVGSGSLSFEMIRYLTERLPAMICPKWVYTRAQPIAVRNVLDYLAGAARVPESAGRIVEIGGADVLSYGDMMRQYAEVRGLRRFMLPVPVLTPRISSLWVHLITPIPAAIAQPLVQGVKNEVIAHGDEARRLFPDIVPLDYRTAVRLALAKLEAGEVETTWSGALSSSEGRAPAVMLATQEGMIIERRTVHSPASPEALFGVFSRLGGAQGWLAWNWAWRIRGAVDRLVGGVGLRRGRRDPDELRVGDAVDFWRVEALEPGRMLRLRAEMKVPGRAWLQFEARPRAEGGSELVQTAYFAPKGLAGHAYWHLLYPVHRVIFSRMAHAVASRAAAARDATA